MTKDEIKNLMFTRVRGVGVHTGKTYEGEFIGYDPYRGGEFILSNEPKDNVACSSIEPIPEPKKRLMTPAELAGGWIVFESGVRRSIIEVSLKHVYTRSSIYEIEDIAEHKGDILGWARSVNGEIESVEVDDE